MYGNMKNRRDVCMARDAGYTTYEGLRGAVKTGCMNSPELGTHHCSLHKVQACNPFTGDEDKDAPQRSESHHKVVEMILEKRTTRKAIYYKVWIDYNIIIQQLSIIQ